MEIFAYCAASFAEATERAAGVRPRTCPPTTARAFEPAWLEGPPSGSPRKTGGGWDLLYFDLHGEPGEAFWRGDDGLIALQAQQVLQADLGGAVVFAANCYLADEDSPMMDALLDAGARYVIGGDGRNWGPGRGPMYGAPLLGLWLRRWMRLLTPLRALAMAKRAVQFRESLAPAAAEDTLAFRAYERKRETRA